MNTARRAPADFLAPAVRDLPPSGIRRFFDLVTQTRGVISLGVGEPDFVTPWHVREAAIWAVEHGYTSYTSNWGLPELRQAIAAYWEQWQGVHYDPSGEILVTVGVAEAIDLALRAILAPGEEVLIPEPCFVSYTACTRLAGGVPVPVPTRPEDGFRLDPAELRRRVTPRTKALLIGFPSNPTGAVLTREELLAVARVAADHDLLVLSDEIYGELTYCGDHISFASLPGMRERTILLSGFSKAHAMTGWRLGYACGPAPILEAMFKIHQYTIMCAPILSQMAAMEALQRGRGEVERMKAEYNRRRLLMVQGFQELGLPCVEPRGAFYIFPSVQGTGLTDEDFALRLLEEEKVAVVPGRAFGEAGAGCIRCSYAASVEKLAAALERMGSFLRRLRG